jgi:hypothetical protein
MELFRRHSRDQQAAIGEGKMGEDEYVRRYRWGGEIQARGNPDGEALFLLPGLGKFLQGKFGL